MRNSLIALGLLLLLTAACLRPGPTPLGPELSDLPVPPVVERMVDSTLVSSIFSWDEPLPLFNPTMLFCGRDRVSGFHSEPLFSFHLDDFAGSPSSLLQAGLLLHLPPQFWPVEEDAPWDNPHIERDLQVRLLRLSSWPDPEEPLESLEALDAWAISDEYFRITDYQTLYGIPLPLDSVQAWVDSSAVGEEVHIALELAQDSDDGILRIYAISSLAHDADSEEASATRASLKIQYETDGGDTPDWNKDCERNGLALGRSSEADATLELASGLPRYCHLELDLPESLLDSSIVVLGARLSLYPDSLATFGVGPEEDGPWGISLRLLAPLDSLDHSSPLLPEDARVLQSSVDLYTSSSQLQDPLVLTITSWLQDWIHGEADNHGLILELNGLDERLRSFRWHQEGPGLSPRLEVFSTGRPDFD